MFAKYIKLNNGNEIPPIGLGTYKSNKLNEVIKKSIELGYRLIDTAFIYENESEIGEVLEEIMNSGIVKREDIFIVSKLWNTQHKSEDVVPAIKTTLSNLRLNYLDLFLVHWPIAVKKEMKNKFNVLDQPEDDVPIEETWQAMEQCVKLGYAKSIGISNFNSIQVDRVLQVAEIKPVVNQVECNPYINQEKLRKFCKEKDIVIMAYSPLYAQNRPYAQNYGLELLEEPIIKEISKKYNKTSSQIVLRFLIQCEVVPIPKTDNLERLKLNFDIFDFILTSEEFEKIVSLDKNLRCTTFEHVKMFKEYPFNIEF